MPQAKCDSDRHITIEGEPKVIRLVWDGRPLVRDARCPFCGAKMKKTTHLLQAPVLHMKPNTEGLL